MQIRSALNLALVMLSVGGATGAMAADAPVHKALSPKATPIFDWTGWYGGINYGTGVSQTTGTSPGLTGWLDRISTGLSLGLQGGYNWQFSTHGVAGIEADISWLGIDRYRRDDNEGAALGVKTNWYATARGRLGYSSGPSLFYVTGGAAFVSVKNRFDQVVPVFVAAGESEIASGWTAGWGIETMLGGNWSARSEYLYVDAGTRAVFNPAVLGGVTNNFDNRFHVFRSALNYRFSASQPAPQAYDWTGFYAGVNGGLSLSQVVADNSDNGSLEIGGSAFSGALLAGYNWQLGPNWVGGVEADFGWLGINRVGANWDDNDTFGVKAGWYGTARARLGRSSGPALIYLTGGVAAVDIQNRFDLPALGTFASRSEIAVGWTIGTGIEAALGGNWTAKAEYLYIDAGGQSVFNPTFGIAGEATRFDNDFHVFRFGFNRRFASDMPIR